MSGSTLGWTRWWRPAQPSRSAPPTPRALRARLLRGDVEATKRRTRNYAKRQLTWMRRLTDVHRIDVTDLAPETAARQMAHILAARPGAA